MPPPHHSSSIGVDIALAAIVIVYVLGLRRFGARSQRLPAWRSAAFLFGIVTIWAALSSDLASCDAGSLTGHMVQHLLLMTIAPPLVLLGEPLSVMAAGMS